MARTWVKLHLKILDSIDLEMLPGETYKRAIQLLCMAGIEDTDGWLPEVSRMAWKFHVTLEQLTQEMHDLQNIEFLAYDPETNAWRIANWSVYQTNSDPGVNERVRRYREKMKHKSNATIKEDGNVTSNVTVTNGNGDVTALDKIREDNILQTREDKEFRAEKPAPPPSKPAPVKVIESKSPTEHQAMFQALEVVTGLDSKLKRNAGRLANCSKELRDAGYTAADVLSLYSPGGAWWFHDFRGRDKHERPIPDAIIATISNLKNLPQVTGPPARAAPNGKQHPGMEAADRVEAQLREDQKNGIAAGSHTSLENVFKPLPQLREGKQPGSS